MWSSFRSCVILQHGSLIEFKEWWINLRLWSEWLIPRYPSHVRFISTTISYVLTQEIDGIHLKQCVTLYLFALPLTLVNDLGWAAVPIVTVVAFTFMGIEGIADEIEMPFGMLSRSIVTIC
jgi:predicted membrane chloride channel (bestrophin family)